MKRSSFHQAAILTVTAVLFSIPALRAQATKSGVQQFDPLAFPGSVPVTTLTSQDLLNCRIALQEKSGEACLIPLCSALPAKTELTSITLKRPVAARVVRVSQITSGSLKVILQPCVIATSTAVTSTPPDAAVNRYVYSVRLYH